jgi:hypothetical protein
MGADERIGCVDTTLPTPDPAWKLNLQAWDGEDEAVARLDTTLNQRGVHIPLDAYSYIGRDFFLRRFLRARNLDVEQVRLDPACCMVGRRATRSR